MMKMLKLLVCQLLKTLLKNIKVDNDGTEEESTLVRRRPNNSEGDNLVAKK